MIRRTILEWQTISHGDEANEIPLVVAERIAAVAAASPLAGQGSGILEHGRKGLRAHGVVGVIVADNGALEILPKIEIAGEEGSRAIGSIRRRLVHMLAVALDLRVDVGRITALDWQCDTLLEILIRIFSEKLIDAVRQSMPRRYVEHTDDLPVLRGRLDVMRQFSVLAAEPSRLACRYDALTSDIALNRIMKAAIARLAGITRSVANQRRLRDLLLVYADIADTPASALRWDEVVLDRTNQRWHELLELARLLLGDRFQTTSAGPGHGFSLIFEMSSLFEKYIARMLKRALAHTDLRVIAQGGRLFCLQTDDQRGLFQTRPDILVKRGDIVVQIIDTKWKRIASRIDAPKQGVSQSDIYQMMAYGQLYRCNRLTLLYPHHATLSQNDGVHAAHRITGSSQQIETASINVGQNERLHERLQAIVGASGFGNPATHGTPNLQLYRVRDRSRAQ